MNLKDTIELMISNDYKNRFLAEYQQLIIRRDGLKAMLKKWDKGELDFKPTCPRGAYDIQLKAMDDYASVLEARAAMENIEL